MTEHHNLKTPQLATLYLYGSTILLCN